MKLRAEVYRKHQLEQALQLENLEYIYVPLGLLEDAKYDERIIIVPPVYLGEFEGETAAKLKSLAQKGFRRALAHTIGHIQLARELGFLVHGGFRLNVTNSLSLAEYEQLGLEDSTVSIELAIARAKRLTPTKPLGIISYGRLPMMVLRRCPLSDGELCGKGGCEGEITDRMGNQLKLFCDTAVEVMNSDLLYMSDKQADLALFDFQILRFTDETELNPVISLYERGRKPEGKLTRGLYYREVQ